MVHRQHKIAHRRQDKHRAQYWCFVLVISIPTTKVLLLLCATCHVDSTNGKYKPCLLVNKRSRAKTCARLCKQRPRGFMLFNPMQWGRSLCLKYPSVFGFAWSGELLIPENSLPTNFLDKKLSSSATRYYYNPSNSRSFGKRTHPYYSEVRATSPGFQAQKIYLQVLFPCSFSCIYMKVL